jgi:spore coat polysaccharide biosynthesis protein SpsF (cytidylyltransferase family)
LNTNLKFIAVRRFANLEWETYQDTKDNTFVAVCHRYSISVQSSDWNGIWEEIMKASKEQFKKQKVIRVNSYG